MCLKNNGCYTERQRGEVDKNDNWACPSCAHLADEHKQKRHSESTKELIQVTWESTWELEDLKKDTQSSFLERVQEFEARKVETDLSLPTVDQLLDNLRESHTHPPPLILPEPIHLEWLVSTAQTVDAWA